MMKSFKFTDKDIEVLSTLKVKLNINTDVGVVRYCLQQAMVNYDKTFQWAKTINEIQVTGIPNPMPPMFNTSKEVIPEGDVFGGIVPKKPSETEIMDYLEHWVNESNKFPLKVFCPIHTQAYLANCGCLKDGGEKLRAWFINNVWKPI